MPPRRLPRRWRFALRKSHKMPKIKNTSRESKAEKGNPWYRERKATGREDSRVACLDWWRITGGQKP
jgi:hypothetical protein